MSIAVQSIRVTFMRGEKGLVGFASCVIDGKWAVDNLAIYSRMSGEGYRILYPSKKLRDGQNIQLFFPISAEAGDAIESAISHQVRELLRE